MLVYAPLWGMTTSTAVGDLVEPDALHRDRRAVLTSGAWGFGLLKLGLDGIVIALIPLGATVGLLLLGALFNSGQLAVDPEMEQDFARFDGPALVLLPASVLVAAAGITIGQRILRRTRIPRPRSLGWSTFGIVTLPWIASFALLTFVALGVASDQTYPADDQYWAMWPIFVVATLVDAAFGALTGAFTTLWISRARAPRPTA
ncbi:MAG: hypothetical protein JWR01_536 [Subtercola sp.]|nr:hypothetical protein [Subtercola sp.]